LHALGSKIFFSSYFPRKCRSEKMHRSIIIW
jgi:hypothetical protein